MTFCCYDQGRSEAVASGGRLVLNLFHLANASFPGTALNYFCKLKVLVDQAQPLTTTTPPPPSPVASA